MDFLIYFRVQDKDLIVDGVEWFQLTFEKCWSPHCREISAKINTGIYNGIQGSL